MKQRIKNKFIAYLCAICFVFLGIFNSTTICIAQENTGFSEEISSSLNFKDEQDMQNSRVTIRQPVMEILERGLPRVAPELLSRTYTLPLASGENSNVSVTFDEYPDLSGKVVLSTFQKYMLVRQIRYYNNRAEIDSENGTLKKHPAADIHYGEIPVEDNAVKKRIVIDPRYKSSLTTGLYLPAGEVVTVQISGLKQGESFTMSTHPQYTGAWASPNETEFFEINDALILEESQKELPDYDSLEFTMHNQYKTSNTLIAGIPKTFYFTENKTYKIGSPFGGALMINSGSLTCSPEIIITGAVETPHFILGVTTIEEFEEHLRNAPGLISILDVENGALYGLSRYMRDTDDIEKVAYMWHSIFAVNQSLTGRSYNTNQFVKFNYYVPAGAAVAIGNYCVCPFDWMRTCLQYEIFSKNGGWGVLHEIGHLNASAFGSIYGMNGTREGEVRNNVLIVLIYTMILDLDTRLDRVEHGFVTHPYLSVQEMLNVPKVDDYDELGYFQALSLYTVLIHAFGPEKFVEYLNSYKFKNNTTQAYVSNRRADFAYRMALINQRNIIPWLNEYYSAGITDDMFTTEQIEFLNSLTEFTPIAYVYSNGINQNESSRKHEINGLETTNFDFTGNNILSTKEFEIIEFTNAKYGTISVADNIVSYYPPTEQHTNDEFICRVKIIETQEIIELPVRFILKYNGSCTKAWKNISAKSLTEAMQNRTEDYIATVNTCAGVPSYSTEGKDYFETTFKYKVKQDGEYKFYLKADDQALAYFGTNIDDLLNSLEVRSYRNNYGSDNVSLNLKKGDVVYFKTYLFNNGGGGIINVGVKLPNSQNVVDISPKQIYPWDVDENVNYVWTPKFIVSVKNFQSKEYVKDKTNWQILSGPVPQGASDLNCLIDGNNSTIFHSKWSPKLGATEMPHEYVLDLGKSKTVNFFEIVTRNNVNSYINSYELYCSNDNLEYTLISQDEKLAYTSLKATINFETLNARYFKLKINSSTGGYFTVMAELNVGLGSFVKNLVKPSNEKIVSSGFESLANGEVISKSKGSKFKFDFSGTQLSIFSNTGKDYGKATIKIDNVDYGIIDLQDETSINKLVYHIDSLQNGKHTVEIETLSNSMFHIGMLNFEYGSQLLVSQSNPSLVFILTFISILTLFLVILFIVINSRNRHFKKNRKLN